MSGYNKNQNKKGERVTDEHSFNWWLIPLILVVAVVPAIMRLTIKDTHYPYYPWYSGPTQYVDFALVWKGYVIGVIGAVMALCNIYIFIRLSKWEKIAFLKRYWPILAYIVLVIASAVFAVNKTAALHGEFGQGEPVYVLLGYGTIALNVPLVVKKEKDLKALLVAFLAGVLFVSLYGVLQACKIEPSNWKPMQYLMLSAAQRSQGKIQMTFEQGRVSSTLYNPNYLGPYVALVLPVILTFLFVTKKIWKKLIALVICASLLVCLVFSGSKTGVIICAGVFIFMILFAFRTWSGILFKKWYIAIPAFLAVILAGKLVIDYVPAANPQRIINALTIKEDNFKLQGVDTTGDCVKIVYKGSVFEFRFSKEDEETVVNVVEDGMALKPLALNSKNKFYDAFQTHNGDRISAEVFEYSKGYEGVKLNVAGYALGFSNQVKSGNYQIVNPFGNMDESIILGGLFKNHKSFASGRGYSWSQFLPVSMKYIFIGAGPDNYPFAVYAAGDDYGYKIATSQETLFFSRPHNLFIQMWINTGFLSLVAFLIFAVWYIVDCFKTYFNKKLTYYLEFIGIACMAGIVGFLGNGIANDSLPCLTPLYWVILGCGIVVNEIVKRTRKG